MRLTDNQISAIRALAAGKQLTGRQRVGLRGLMFRAAHLIQYDMTKTTETFVLTNEGLKEFATTLAKQEGTR